ncbi:MAG: NADH-quinone oxidoreductase subunit C [Candidatus Omnitrophota bacterium]|nr:NADH-quinone oxidoreductase subunit C [Candidatus Omnitrophota bacterium]
MKAEDIRAKLEKNVPSAKIKVVRDSLLVENPADLHNVVLALKSDSDLRLDYLSSLTASDFVDYLETVYHLYSIDKRIGPVVLRVRVKRDNPKIPSLVAIYRGAEFQEREAYDTYGITYEGHPDLRRIFMWEGFEGFPMRKDYEQEDSETLDKDDIEWLDRNGVKVPDEMRQKALNPPAPAEDKPATPPAS